MSNIFAPLVRPYGTLPVELGSGPIVGGTEYMHMWVNDEGYLQVSNDVITHYGAAVPFDAYGRVVISSAEVVRWDQDIPFTASGAVAMAAGEDLAQWDQGLIFLESGHIATGSVAPPDTAPIWSTIPDRQNYLYELPQTYDVSPYVTSGGQPITGYALIGAPDFFTIDNAGVITCGVGTAAGSHVLTVQATNSVGSSTTTFTWTLITGNVPTWDPLPNQQHRQNELPQQLDVKPYASSDSGPILSYSLVAPPSGFTMTNGVITVAAGTAVSSYLLTVRATNGVGAGDTVFTWDILEILTVPQWSTISDQTDVQSDLPETFDVSPFVTSNSGALRNWALITPPAGFSIDQSGVVTVSAGTAIAVHAIVVQVENDEGSASEGFTWTITAQLLPPQWQTIPNQTTSEGLLPTILDVSTYASSNSGPLTGWNLVTPPTGFTINSGTGVITVAAGTSPAVYQLTVEVTNDTGTSQSSPFDWEITLFYLAPEWQTIPDQSTSENLLPTILNAATYVSSNSGPLTGWTLVAPPAGFTISAAGVITAAAGIAPGDHSITVEVTNDTGTTQSAPFNWEILLFYVVPQWSAIPAQSNGDDELPTTLNTAPYVTTNSGPLTSWTLVTPPSGFAIDAAGVITVAAGTTSAAHQITVRVSNDEGSADSDPFTWTITDVLLPPQWSTIPDQTTREDDLPASLDVNPYVSSNDGPLTGWLLLGAPAGVTIDAGGVISVAAGVAPGGYSLQVRVSNNSGQTASNIFDWDIDAFFLPPQWSPVPDQTDAENILPQSLSMTSYVTSNHGALFGWGLTGEPAGITINTSGLVTVADGTAPGVYPMTTQVSNSSGQTSSASWDWEITLFYLVPQWSTIPDQSTEEQFLPVVLDVKSYVSTNHGPLANWSLVSPPGGWTISSDGIITVAAARPVGSNQITVRVSNDTGSADSAAFTWDILEEPLPPQWSTIPDRQDRENTLPQSYDVAPYASTNSGPLTGWTLVSPPAGFTINGAGLITAAAGTTVAAHNLTVRVSNDEGNSDASFEWEIQEELLPPQWGTVPDQSDRINTLPQTLNASLHVTSNAGNLTLWRLASAPAGFSINSSTGIVTATAAAGVGSHSLRIGVTNNRGESLSNTFTWDILEELLPPQWSTIPDRSDANDSFPNTYDVSGYVTTNNGPLISWSLIGAPGGFTINQSGVITAATGVATGDNGITVSVGNNSGTNSTSFTWTREDPLSEESIHDFNADLGPYSFTRSGNSTWDRYNSANTWDTVGTDVPTYPNCPFNGTIYTPDSGFHGILVEGESTNYVDASSDMQGWYKVTAGTFTPDAITLATSDNIGGVINLGAGIVGEQGIMSVDAGQFGGSATSFVMNSEYKANGNEVVQAMTIDAQRYSENILLTDTDGSRGWNISPNGFGGSGSLIALHYGMEVDDKKLEASSRIITSGAAATRAAVHLSATMSALGMTDGILNEMGGQMVFRPQHLSNAGQLEYMLVIGGGGSYYIIICNISQNTIEVWRSGTTLRTVTQSYTWSVNERLDIRWIARSDRVLRMWINGVQGGTDNNLLDDCVADSPNVVVVGRNSSETDASSGIIVERLRYKSGAVTDGEILGWT